MNMSQEFREPIMDPALRPQILKFLMWRNDHYKDYVRVEARVYADEEEQAAMELCHDKCVDILDDFMGSIALKGNVRALDVAGGDARVASSRVMRTYKLIDLFDQCSVAVQKAMIAMKSLKNCGKIVQSSMQTFQWAKSYSAIFMVWCSGYLNDVPLKQFLQDAQMHLLPNRIRVSRHSPPESFIILLDNIRNELEEPFKNKGQWLRSQKELESLFTKAGLIIFKRSSKIEMPNEYRDIMIWALY